MSPVTTTWVSSRRAAGSCFAVGFGEGGPRPNSLSRSHVLVRVRVARRAAGDEGGECSRGVRRWSCCCSCFFFAVPCAHPVRDTRRWMETGNGMIWEGGGRWDLGGKSRECALVVLGPSGGSTEGGQWTCRGQAAAKSVLVLSASGQGCPKGGQGRALKWLSASSSVVWIWNEIHRIYFFPMELHFQIQVWILLISWPGTSQKLRGDGQWLCCAAAREGLIWFLLPCLISRISFQNLITSQNSF